MARGRHRRRTGLLARLWPARRRVRLEVELARVRALAEASAATASTALVRASDADDRALRAEARALLAEQQLAAVRADVAALREELVWAFAEGRMPAAPAVIDLRDEAARPA